MATHIVVSNGLARPLLHDFLLSLYIPFSFYTSTFSRYISSCYDLPYTPTCTFRHPPTYIHICIYAHTCPPYACIHCMCTPHTHTYFVLIIPTPFPSDGGHRRRRTYRIWSLHHSRAQFNQNLIHPYSVPCTCGSKNGRAPALFVVAVVVTYPFFHSSFVIVWARL